MATKKKISETPIETFSVLPAGDILIPVIDNSNLARDPNSKAILNTNKSAYIKAVKAKQERDMKNQEIQALKDDVAELKSMLKQLLGKAE